MSCFESSFSMRVFGRARCSVRAVPSLIHCRIFVFAFDVLTKLSQSLLGLWVGLVRISTVSPLFRTVTERDELPVHLGAHAPVAEFGWIA